MAESNNAPNSNVFSENDPLDINELASLNEEISTDFIEQLQNQIAANVNAKNDGDLFEEPEEEKPEEPQDIEPDPQTTEEPSIDTVSDAPEETSAAQTETDDIQQAQQQINENDIKSVEESNIENKNDIEAVSGGNIIEKPMTKETAEYSKSLDYLDDNVKYSKYVIYVDPENKDFIDSLTVKERKNIINRILHEQDSIAVTKRRLAKMQIIFTHMIIAILTITIAIPCIYWAINASLEATINNYRASQSNFGQLYREHGKIKTNSSVK